MHPVIRKLSLFSPLSSEEASAMELALSRWRKVPAKQEIAGQGEKPTAIEFVLSGIACRQKLLDDGRRQILSFLLPGDACDVGVTLLARRDHSVVALSDCKVASVSSEVLRHLDTQYPKLRDALQWATLVEEAIAREWLANVGQRSGLERMAHLFLEHYYRTQAVGLADGSSCPLPITQLDLGDALGVSAIHANRTLQELRGRGLVAFGDRRLTILDLPGLRELAAFDETYLHLPHRGRQEA